LLELEKTYEIYDLALQNEGVEGFHYFLDARVPVPPVEEQQVDVGRTQFFEGCFDGHVQRFRVVACIEDFLLNRTVAAFVVCSVL
jgi:hypothetical protein